MNWEIIASTGDWAGAIAVVATLFYLARQIQESNRVARTSATQDIMNGFVSLNELIISNPEFADSLARLKVSGTVFTPAALVQLEHYCYRYLALYTAVQAAHDNGHLDIESYNLIKGDMRSIFGVYPGLSYYFKVVLDREGAGQSTSQIVRELAMIVDEQGKMRNDA